MEIRCPYCNYLAVKHETLDGEKNPSVGDISFCINCGEVNKFTKEGVAKVNIEDLNSETRTEVKAIESAWLQTRNLHVGGP